MAGAAGTALFITVMTRGTVAGTESGAALVDAAMQGIHAALMYGGAISAAAVLVALLVRRPAPAPEAVVTHPEG